MGVVEGDQRRIDVGTLSLPGFIERVGQPPHQEELLLRTSEPTPGLAHWFAMRMGELTALSLRFYFYGDSAHETVQRDEPLWRAWMDDPFPSTQKT